MNRVQSFNKDGETWYNAAEVAGLFGYTQPRVAVTKMLKGLHQQLAGDLNLAADKRKRFITTKGVQVMAAKSNKPNSLAICEELGIEVQTIKCALKATESFAEIMSVFDGERMVHEFSIGSYRIDLYFVDYKLAVECDEYGHQRYDANKESERTAFVDRVLGCTWIRFNPDSRDFRLAQVINRIYRHIRAANVK